MPLASLSLLLLAAAQTPPTAPEEDVSDRQRIVVTGERLKGKEHLAEEPYPMVERNVLGSRIKRKMDQRGFRTVASEAGLAGLMSTGGGMGQGGDGGSGFSVRGLGNGTGIGGGGLGVSIDATGGANARIRNRIIKECKSRYEKLTEKTACELWLVEKAIDEGRFADAEKSLDVLLNVKQLPKIDRYHAANYAYSLADAKDDDAGKLAALKILFETGQMPLEERHAALKTMVRLSLKQNDQPTAIATLEEYLTLNPDDAPSNANLATLYAWQGEHQKALPRMQTAVSLVQQKGGTPPKSWTDYVNDRSR